MSKQEKKYKPSYSVYLPPKLYDLCVKYSNDNPDDLGKPLSLSAMVRQGLLLLLKSEIHKG